MQDIIHNTDKRVSIQIDLSGYSFIVQEGGQIVLKMQERNPAYRNDLSRIVTSLGQKIQHEGSRYEGSTLEVSYHTSHYVLVPEEFYDENRKEDYFKEMHSISGAGIQTCRLSSFKNVVLLYTIPDAVAALADRIDAEVTFLPSVYLQLEHLAALKEYNRLVMDYRSGLLTVTVADSEQLLLCNSFKAQDYDTALYFVLNALKTLNLNPEQSVLYSMSEVSAIDMEKTRRFLRDIVILQ